MQCKYLVHYEIMLIFALANTKNDHSLHGEMAEWSNAPVLKTGVLQGTGGSNPSLSATESCKSKDLQDFCFLWF